VNSCVNFFGAQFPPPPFPVSSVFYINKMQGVGFLVFKAVVDNLLSLFGFLHCLLVECFNLSEAGVSG
jgi:hypothetical protein